MQEQDEVANTATRLRERARALDEAPREAAAHGDYRAVTEATVAAAEMDVEALRVEGRVDPRAAPVARVRREG